MERIYQTPILRMIPDLTFPQAALLVFVAVLIVWFHKWIFSAKTIHNIEEKYILITGCDSGFGKSTAIELDRLGFHVFATCLTNDGAEDLKHICSDRLVTISLDVTRSHEIQSALKVVKRFLPPAQGLWGVVNNAGVGKVSPIEWSTLEDFKWVADVNLWGVVDVTKVFLPLVKRAKGRIVNIASIAGRTCLPHASAYSISKFGVEAFSDALRREMSVAGVSVSIVEPGFFKTGLTDKRELETHWNKAWDGLSDELREEYGEKFRKTGLRNVLKGMVDTCASPHVSKVVDVIMHALTSTTPKTRYVVGWDANLLWVWISRLPAKVGDALLAMLGEDATPLVIERARGEVKDENMDGYVKTS